jgi:uncharacterized protein (UPF0332 family)
MAKRQTQSAQSSSRFAIVTALLIAALFLMALFQRALFNGLLPHFDAAILLSGILALLFGLYFCFHYFRLREKPAVWPMLFIWLIPLTTLISSVGAVSKHGAFMSVIIHVLYALIFIFAYAAVRSDKSREYAAAVFLCSGFVVVLFGFVNWLGLNIYVDAVNNFSGEVRLMSVFQYANTYGAFLIALALASLFVIMHSGSKFLRFISAAMLPLLLIALILTLSRGAWLAFPVLFVFVLLFLQPSRQLLYLLYAIAGGIPALAVFSLVNRLGIELQDEFSLGRFLLGAGLLFAASAASAGIGHLIHLRMEPVLGRWSAREQKRIASLWVPLGLVAATAGLGALLLKTSLLTLLPDNIEQRVTGINFAQHSVLERFSFYADALAISRDYPMFGAGGGAWLVLYDHYQSYPYLSTQVHNFALQHLVEFGWIGLAALFAVFAFILIRYFIQAFGGGLNDSSFVFFVAAVSLIAHSLIDFNFSYVTIGAVVYFSLGIMAQRLPAWKLPREGSTTTVYAFVLPILLLFALFASIRAYDGYLSYMKTNQLLKSGQSSAAELVQVAAESVHKGKQFAYYQTFYQVHQLLYGQTGDPSYLSGIGEAVALMEKNEPERRDTLVARYVTLMSESRYDEAVRLLIDGTDKYPWDLGIYTEAFHQLFDMGKSEPSHWDEALALFEKMEGKMDQIRELPPYQVQTKPFEVTAEIARIISQIQYLKQDYASAHETIVRYLNPRPGFTADEPDAMKQYLGL